MLALRRRMRFVKRQREPVPATSTKKIGPACDRRIPTTPTWVWAVTARDKLAEWQRRFTSQICNAADSRSHFHLLVSSLVDKAWTSGRSKLVVPSCWSVFQFLIAGDMWIFPDATSESYILWQPKLSSTVPTFSRRGLHSDGLWSGATCLFLSLAVLCGIVKTVFPNDNIGSDCILTVNAKTSKLFWQFACAKKHYPQKELRTTKTSELLTLQGTTSVRSDLWDEKREVSMALVNTSRSRSRIHNSMPMGVLPSVSTPMSNVVFDVSRAHGWDSYVHWSKWLECRERLCWSESWPVGCSGYDQVRSKKKSVVAIQILRHLWNPKSWAKQHIWWGLLFESIHAMS